MELKQIADVLISKDSDKQQRPWWHTRINGRAAGVK